MTEEIIVDVAGTDALTVHNAAPAPLAHTLSTEYINRWIRFLDGTQATEKTYVTNLRQFVAWLNYAGIDIAHVSRDDILAYRAWLTKEHDAIELDTDSVTGWRYRMNKAGNRQTTICKAGTVANYLRSVKQFFRWTAAEGIYPDISANVHAPKIRNNTHKKDALTPADVQTIEESIVERAQEQQDAAEDATKDKAGRMQRSTEQGKRLFAMYSLAVNAGLRTVEISRANIKDLETKDGVTYLYIWGKGHAEPDQRKPIAMEVKAAIDDYLQSRTDSPTGNSPLFVSTGNRSRGKRIAPTTISTMLKTALKEAGFNSDRLTAHSLRHTTGTAVQDLTGNIFLTQQYMRHKDPKTTEIYVHAETEKQEADIAERLYQRYHGTEEAQDARAKLERVIDRMTPQQMEQLTMIAEAMAK